MEVNCIGSFTVSTTVSCIWSARCFKALKGHLIVFLLMFFPNRIRDIRDKRDIRDIRDIRDTFMNSDAHLEPRATLLLPEGH